MTENKDTKYGKLIRITDELTEILDKARHPGQSYDGIIKELISKNSETVVTKEQP